MKSLSTLAVAIAASLAAQAMASLPHQPYIVPTEGEFGAYAVQSQLLGPGDADLAKAYDNFTLADDKLITGFEWAGLYAQALPAAPSDTDFIVEIWGVDAANDDHADVASGPIYTFNFEGGTEAGMGGPDLVVTALGHVSPSTDATPGGGEAFHYAGEVAPIMIPAGDYWISILANQLFDNPDPVVDPEWQWHLGDGPGDGFTAYDRFLDPAGTPEAGLFQVDKDLAFSIVPEPSTGLLVAMGLCSLGLIRRKRG